MAIVVIHLYYLLLLLYFKLIDISSYLEVLTRINNILLKLLLVRYLLIRFIRVRAIDVYLYIDGKLLPR
jgi:hypothetical protein